MGSIKRAEKKAGKWSANIEKGFLAGVLGTIAITAAQEIEMKITARKASSSPAKAAEKILGITPSGKKDSERSKHERNLSRFVYWTYDTAWGGVRRIIESTGLRG